MEFHLTLLATPHSRQSMVAYQTTLVHHLYHVMCLTQTVHLRANVFINIVTPYLFAGAAAATSNNQSVSIPTPRITTALGILCNAPARASVPCVPLQVSFLAVACRQRSALPAHTLVTISIVIRKPNQMFIVKPACSPYHLT